MSPPRPNCGLWRGPIFAGNQPLPFEQAWRERLLSVNPVYYDSAEGIELDGVIHISGCHHHW